MTFMPNSSGITPLISVVITNWNGAHVLPRCLEALSCQTFRDFEIIVVDDASTDASTDEMQSHFPDVRVIKSTRNVGFAAANNLGAKTASGRWLALLNNDAFPHPDWLERLRAAIKQHPEYAIFASRLVQAEQPERLDGAGDVYHVSGLAWRRYHGQKGEQLAQNAEEVFSACGAAALYSRDVFLYAGGFDEDFVAYHEDVDLGFRLRLQGHRCLYVPDAIVEHLGSSSYGKKSNLGIYHGHRNLVWTFFKNMPRGMLWRYLPAHLLGIASSLFYHSIHGHVRAIWSAKIDAARGLPRILQKRKEIQRKLQVSDSEISRWMDHRWFSPYQRKALWT